MLFHSYGVGFGSTLVIYSTSVKTGLDSTPIDEGYDSFSFDWKYSGDFFMHPASFFS